MRITGSVLIGAVGRNRGKTEFARAAIHSLSSRYRVHAVKVTNIRNGEIACVHGDRSCGVCAAMTTDCVVSEELDVDGSKDTSRMLAAGAERVWWVRVREHSLAHAASRLRTMVPDDGVLVMESNSIREVVEPDLFFMLGDPGGPDAKESARSVRNAVDRFVSFDGSSFDFDPGEIAFTVGRCDYRRKATAIVLAGGRSTRMGSDKRFLTVQGLPLVGHVCRQIDRSFEEVLLSVDRAESVTVDGVHNVPDRHPDSGPMGGVISALEASQHDINFVTACDIPSIDLDFVHSMLRMARHHDVVVPIDKAGRYQPLFAVYSRKVLPRLRTMLAGGELRIRMVYDQVDTHTVPIPPGVELASLNTPTEYRTFLAG